MINFNGSIISEEEVKLSADNRGFLYGDALFETIRVINGDIMFWEDHYFRLMASMRIMRMEIPLNFSPEFLEDQIKKLIVENSFEELPARVRLNVFRQDGGRYLPKTNDVNFLMTAGPLDAPFYQWQNQEYEIELFKDHYVQSGLLSTLKTNNKAINILASVYSKENGYDNCLLINEKKNVVEAINANLFLVKDGVVKTPPLEDGCLKGVTRGKVMEIIKKDPNLELDVSSISPFELQKADELFLTNVVLGIQPVSRYRKKVYSSEIAKKLLPRLNTLARLVNNQL